jgi:hypothetical protein
MTIPDRLRLRPIDKTVIGRMNELCDQIECELESGGDAVTLLDEWHTYARKHCDPYDFQTYWKSISKESFVLDALNPSPAYEQDVRYWEVIDVLDAISVAAIPESEIQYYIGWLEAQFPNSDINNLIYWPDEWFRNASLFRDASGLFKPEASLSYEQIIGYAMAKSGRQLDDAPPNIDLPYPIP